MYGLKMIANAQFFWYAEPAQSIPNCIGRTVPASNTSHATCFRVIGIGHSEHYLPSVEAGCPALVGYPRNLTSAKRIKTLLSLAKMISVKIVPLLLRPRLLLGRPKLQLPMTTLNSTKSCSLGPQLR